MFGDGDARASRFGDKVISKDRKRANINEQIRAQTVRLILADGTQAGIMPVEEARQAAADVGMDLVEMAPDAVPVVVKIMNYGKHRFDESKSKAAERKRQKRTQLKEMRFRPGTDAGDYRVKLRKLTEFLLDGDKTKVTLRFRGRELAHKVRGMELLKRVETDLAEISVLELEPKMEGRQLTMVLAPRTGRKKPVASVGAMMREQGEPSANEEPSANKEPSAGQEPSANEEPSAGQEPSANKEPSAEAEADGPGQAPGT